MEEIGRNVGKMEKKVEEIGKCGGKVEKKEEVGRKAGINGGNVEEM